MDKKQPHHHQLKQIESLFNSSSSNNASAADGATGTTTTTSNGTNGTHPYVNNMRSTKSPEVAILESERDHNCDVHGDHGHHHHHHQSYRRGSTSAPFGSQGSLLRRDSSIGSTNGYANAINRKDSTQSSGYGTVRMRKKDPSAEREFTGSSLQRRQSFVAGTGMANRKLSNVSDNNNNSAR